jgi:hypothetical protein
MRLSRSTYDCQRSLYKIPKNCPTQCHKKSLKVFCKDLQEHQKAKMITRTTCREAIPEVDQQAEG